MNYDMTVLSDKTYKRHNQYLHINGRRCVYEGYLLAPSVHGGCCTLLCSHLGRTLIMPPTNCLRNVRRLMNRKGSVTRLHLQDETKVNGCTERRMSTAAI